MIQIIYTRQKDQQDFTAVIRRDIDGTFCVSAADGLCITKGFTSVLEASEYVFDIMPVEVFDGE